MTALTKGKHLVAEIEGVRCTVVEAGLSEARMRFLRELLSFNRYEVKVDIKQEESGNTYTLGVTDILFNPVIAIYARKLKLPDGRIVTPAYYRQETEEVDPRYWRFAGRPIDVF